MHDIRMRTTEHSLSVQPLKKIPCFKTVRKKKELKKRLKDTLALPILFHVFS